MVCSSNIHSLARDDYDNDEKCEKNGLSIQLKNVSHILTDNSSMRHSQVQKVEDNMIGGILKSAGSNLSLILLSSRQVTKFSS